MLIVESRSVPLEIVLGRWTALIAAYAKAAVNHKAEEVVGGGHILDCGKGNLFKKHTCLEAGDGSRSNDVHVRVAGSDSNTYADAARNEILTYVGNLVVIEHQVDVVRYDVNTILVETGEIVAENVMSRLADDCPTLGNLDYRVRGCWYASDSCNQQDESECTEETGNYAVPAPEGSARCELHGLFLSLDTKRMDPAGGVLRLMLSDYRSAGRHDSCIFGCSAWRWPVRGNSSGNGCAEDFSKKENCKSREIV